MIEENMILRVLSAVNNSRYAYTENSQSYSSINVSFEDFGKLNIIILIRKGNPSIFTEFWLKVYIYLMIAIESIK